MCCVSPNEIGAGLRVRRCLWTSFKDEFGKLGYVLNISESKPFLKNLSSASIAELGTEAVVLEVEGTATLFFPGSHASNRRVRGAKTMALLISSV